MRSAEVCLLFVVAFIPFFALQLKNKLTTISKEIMARRLGASFDTGMTVQLAEPIEVAKLSEI